MGKFKRVLVLEVEEAKDKNAETPGGKYRRDSPWLVESFKKKGVESDILFITGKDTAASLKAKYPDTAFLGRVNPMDYPSISLNHYVQILNDFKKEGILLGPEADHMDRLGSKMILYELKDTGMGVKGTILHSYDAMKKNDGEIDRIIPKGGPPRVLKMLRGSTGLGVWKLENKDDHILMTDAYNQTTKEIARKDVIPEFLALCQEDAISMPFLPLIKDGEFRFLLSKHKILEVVHKKPVDESAFTATLRSGAIYTTLDLNEHKSLVDTVVAWTHELKTTCKLDDVPYWWSVDCIEEELGPEGLQPGQIPSSKAGRRLVLSEINCSCLGLVADTSAEAKAKGLKFSDLIADIVLS
ncbi:hypothetical protein HELRODRAFT_186118 [Helobdella robusta]|uniref:DUF6815 domain-containing protein n=1 Tax=Helobdella robusta TaxID=6412 RepID=T1FNP2_HELRO|nr:hypothetical protein HELRODRAFT_186118 [Helobdella robusta]ESN93338.1 hypothetical protein HELRODRAFT_186118 [Helobdella robusta]